MRKNSTVPVTLPPTGSAADAAPTRTPGYRGMPRSEWSEWRQVAETFVAEAPLSDPERALDVLLIGLRDVGSWGDFTAGGCRLAAGEGTDIFECFVTWLHGRGDLTDWQRDVLLTKIDDARAAHGERRARSTRTEEMVVTAWNRGPMVDAFLATLDDEPECRLAESVIDCVESMICAGLGEPRHVPLGALDTEAFIGAWLDESDDLRFTADVFVLIARFYHWLGYTGRLDETRADEIGTRLASAGLGITAWGIHDESQRLGPANRRRSGQS